MAYALFRLKKWKPSEYYDMGAGERLITRALLKQELQDIKEEMRDEGQVRQLQQLVKLIDDFSNPSREVAAQARDLEKRFNSVAGVFSHAGEAFTCCRRNIDQVGHCTIGSGRNCGD
ncbi:MAG: hypothetical protein ACLRIT_05405 [Blautia sp.]